MSETAIVLIVQLVAGVFGGVAAGRAAGEHNLGGFGNSIVGAIGGFVGGWALGDVALVTATASGDLERVGTPVEEIVIQILVAGTAGGILAFAAGVVRQMISEHKSH